MAYNSLIKNRRRQLYGRLAGGQWGWLCKSDLVLYSISWHGMVGMFCYGMHCIPYLRIVYWLAWYVTWLKDSVCLCKSRMKIRLYIVLHGRVSYDIVWCGIQLCIWYHVVCYMA